MHLTQRELKKVGRLIRKIPNILATSLFSGLDKGFVNFSFILRKVKKAQYMTAAFVNITFLVLNS